MLNLNECRNQHKELLVILSKLLVSLKKNDYKKNPEEINNQFSLLGEKVKKHLAMEDKFIYPNLLRHSDVEVQKKAQKFLDEMSNINKKFSAYLDKWHNAPEININPQDFAGETEIIINALINRIKKEDMTLYPLVENSLYGESI